MLQALLKCGREQRPRSRLGTQKALPNCCAVRAVLDMPARVTLLAMPLPAVVATVSGLSADVQCWMEPCNLNRENR